MNSDDTKTRHEQQDDNEPPHNARADSYIDARYPTIYNSLMDVQRITMRETGHAYAKFYEYYQQLECGQRPDPPVELVRWIDNIAACVREWRTLERRMRKAASKLPPS